MKQGGPTGTRRRCRVHGLDQLDIAELRVPVDMTGGQQDALLAPTRRDAYKTTGATVTILITITGYLVYLTPTPTL